jgi:hypothetical protein
VTLVLNVPIKKYPKADQKNVADDSAITQALRSSTTRNFGEGTGGIISSTPKMSLDV